MPSNNNNHGNHNNHILKYKPIQKFVDGIGKEVFQYLQKDKACIIGLGDDGVFYGEGLYAWLKQKGSSVIFTMMDYDCHDLDVSAVRGRKVVIVDNDIITGTSYRSVMQEFVARREELQYADVKFAVLCDRTNLADFAVEGYTVTAGAEMIKLDALDYKILQLLSKDGRASFSDIAKATRLTSAGAKKRVEKMMRNGVLQVRGLLPLSKFYSVAACITAKVDSRHVAELLEALQKLPMVCFLEKLYDEHNVSLGVVAPSLPDINTFVDQHLHSAPGVRNVVVHVGDVPLVPSSK